MEAYVARPINTRLTGDSESKLIGFIVDKVDVIEKIVHKNPDTDVTIKTTFLCSTKDFITYEYDRIFDSENACQIYVNTINNEQQTSKFSIYEMHTIKAILDELQEIVSSNWEKDNIL